MLYLALGYSQCAGGVGGLIGVGLRCKQGDVAGGAEMEELEEAGKGLSG